MVMKIEPKPIKGQIKLAGNAVFYGLTKNEWMLIFKMQGSKCPICGGKDKKFVVDHEHVRGWRRMPANEKRKYVRGIPCLDCNRRILKKGITVQKLKNAVTYLEAYEKRRPK